MNTILRRARWRRGISQADLAKLARTSQPQIQRLERGERQIDRDWALRLAPLVGTTPQELIFGDLSCEIVGKVGAGAEAHYYDAANLGRARLPMGASNDTVAVEVSGDSAGAAFNGWLIYYDDRREPPTDDLIGLACVVGLASGQVLVKILMRGRQPGRYDLFPLAGGLPIADQEVEWAAKVIGMLPPWLAKIEDGQDDSPDVNVRPRRKPAKRR